jgi:hypothetical protein
MALTIVIILTFAFPAVIAAMVWYWSHSVKRKVSEKQKRDDELVTLLERIVATKDSIIKSLKEFISE